MQPADNDFRFDQPKPSQDLGVVVQQSWIDKHREQLIGGMRFISHSMIIASGFGLGAAASGFRVVTGALGVVASLMMAFGAKLGFSQDATNRRALETYLSSAVSLAVSGIMSGRPVEAFSGAWSAAGFGLKRLAPDGEEPEPKPEGVGEKMKWYLRDRWRNPARLAPDMLQINAAYVLIDALLNDDRARLVSGVMLLLSNCLLLGVKKDKPERPQSSQGGVSL